MTSEISQVFIDRSMSIIVLAHLALLLSIIIRSKIIGPASLSHYYKIDLKRNAILNSMGLSRMILFSKSDDLLLNLLLWADRGVVLLGVCGVIFLMVQVWR